MACSYSISSDNKEYYAVGTTPTKSICSNASNGDYKYSRSTHCCYILHEDLNTTLYGAGADYTQLGLTSPEALFLYGLCGVLVGWQFGKNLWGYS